MQRWYHAKIYPLGTFDGETRTVHLLVRDKIGCERVEEKRGQQEGSHALPTRVFTCYRREVTFCPLFVTLLYQAPFYVLRY